MACTTKGCAVMKFRKGWRAQIGPDAGTVTEVSGSQVKVQLDNGREIRIDQRLLRAEDKTVSQLTQTKPVRGPGVR